MKNLIVIISLLVTSINSFASGCIQGAGFQVCGTTCADNNANPLQVCFCVGGAYDLPGSTSIFWDFGDGSTSTAVDPCHTYSVGGTYTVYRRMTISCSSIFSGCYLHMFSMSKVCDYSRDIIVYDQSFASTLSTAITCPDNFGTATFAPTSTNGVSWMWDAAPTDMTYQPDPSLPAVNKPIVVSATNLVETNLGPGAHNLYYSYGAGCYGVENFNFDLVVLDNLFISSDYNGEDISCYQASDGQVTAEASGGIQPLTYTWDNGFTETNTTGTSINDNIPAGSYNVDITDANGCLVTETIIVTEPDELIGTVVVTPTICGLPPITGDVEVTAIIGGVPTYTTVWSNGSNLLLLDNVPSDTYDLTITDLNGCEYTESVILYNSSEPVANFSVANQCLYDDAQFQDLSHSLVGTITNWDWNFDDGLTSTNQNPSHTYLASGDYVPSLTVTNSDNCTHTKTQNLTMYPIPLALFSVDNQCQETPLCFTDLSSVGAPDNISSYIYNFGDVSPFNATSDPCHLYTAPGNYDVTLIVSTNNGCIDDTTSQITVHPEPEIDLSATTICVNQPPTVFTNLSSVLNPDNFQTWTWDFGDGYSSSLESPTHNYSTAGDYTVVLNGITNNNCTKTAQIVVTVYEKPKATFTSNIVDSCSIACINFESTSTSPTANISDWKWDFNNGETSTLERPSSCFENLSNTDELTYDIKLITTNDLGCIDTITSVEYITVWHNPLADFDANSFEIEMYSPNFEFYNLSIGADSYDWNFGDNDNSILENPFHTYRDTGTYEVMLLASTIHNCTDTIWKPVRVKAVTSIYAPNTFTPDGDDLNDIFRVVGYNLVDIELLIFDRWGTLLYTGNGLNAGWDGTYKGKKSQQDAYVWMIKAIDGFGERKNYTGHINLLR